MEQRFVSSTGIDQYIIARNTDTAEDDNSRPRTRQEMMEQGMEASRQFIAKLTEYIREVGLGSEPLNFSDPMIFPLAIARTT